MTETSCEQKVFLKRLMEAQSAMPWPCVCNFLCLAVTALRYFEKYSEISYWPVTCYDKYIYTDWHVLATDCCLQNCDTTEYLWCLVCVLNWWFFLNFDMSWGNQVHSNPSTNQQTEKKHSKRKALYRPLKWTEPLKKKSRVRDWSTICKKKYSE